MKISVFIRIFAMLSSGLALVCGGFVRSGFPIQPRQEFQVRGVEVCQGCHEDVYKSFTKSAHAETLKSKNPATRGCEACHGPGADHANARRSRTHRALQRRQAGSDSGPLRTLSRSRNQPGAHQGSSQLLDMPLCPPRLAAQALLVKPSQELCRGCHHTK